MTDWRFRLMLVLVAFSATLLLVSTAIGTWQRLHPPSRTYVCTQVEPNHWECR